MDGTSSSALSWFAVILVVLATVALSPTFGMLLIAIAAACALIATFIGGTTQRLFAGAVFTACLVGSYFAYPAYQSDYGTYIGRARMSLPLAYAGRVERALAAACAEGKFIPSTSLKDIGVGEGGPQDGVLAAALHAAASGAVRLKIVVAEIQGALLGALPWTIVPPGSELEFEFSCTPERKFSKRLVASTVPPKYLPSSLRD